MAIHTITTNKIKSIFYENQFRIQNEKRQYFYPYCFKYYLPPQPPGLLVVGAWVGCAVVDAWVGWAVVGAWVGLVLVGAWVGWVVVGAWVGWAVVGAWVGWIVVGVWVGWAVVGALVDCTVVGAWVGWAVVGAGVGLTVGDWVGSTVDVALVGCTVLSGNMSISLDISGLIPRPHDEFVKSSKSIAHTIDPPRPFCRIYSAYINTEKVNKNL